MKGSDAFIIGYVLGDVMGSYKRGGSNDQKAHDIAQGLNMFGIPLNNDTEETISAYIEEFNARYDARVRGPSEDDPDPGVAFDCTDDHPGAAS